MSFCCPPGTLVFSLSSSSPSPCLSPPFSLIIVCIYYLATQSLLNVTKSPFSYAQIIAVFFQLCPVTRTRCGCCTLTIWAESELCPAGARKEAMWHVFLTWVIICMLPLASGHTPQDSLYFWVHCFFSAKHNPRLESCRDFIIIINARRTSSWCCCPSAAPGLRCRVMGEHHSSPSCAALFCEPDVSFGHEVLTALEIPDSLSNSQIKL